MIEQIKKDKINLALFAITVIVAIFTCLLFTFLGWQFLNRFQAPAVIPTAGPSPTPIILEFRGTGDKVVFFDAPASGAGLIFFAHTGDSNFIVNLMRDDGILINQPVNEIGEYQGEKTLRIDKGRYMLEITADGDWFINILPPQ